MKKSIALSEREDVKNHNLFKKIVAKSNAELAEKIRDHLKNAEEGEFFIRESGGHSGELRVQFALNIKRTGGFNGLAPYPMINQKNVNIHCASLGKQDRDEVFVQSKDLIGEYGKFLKFVVSVPDHQNYLYEEMIQKYTQEKDKQLKESTQELPKSTIGTDHSDVEITSPSSSLSFGSK